MDVVYPGDKTKTHYLKLAYEHYGPAQCKVDTVRFGGESHESSYTHGWVFLVPQPEPAAAV